MDHTDVADRVRRAYETAPVVTLPTDQLVRAGRGRRRHRAIGGGALAAVASMLLATVVTSAPWREPNPQVAQQEPAIEWNPAYLSGLWRVTDAEAQDPGPAARPRTRQRIPCRR